MSECHVCKAHLIKQIEDLASKANAAVYNRADETDEDNDEQDEQDEDESNEAEVDFEGEDAGEVAVQSVFAMIQEISSWSRPSPPSC